MGCYLRLSEPVCFASVEPEGKNVRQQLAPVWPLLRLRVTDGQTHKSNITQRYFFKGSVERSRHERHFCSLLPYFLLS